MNLDRLMGPDERETLGEHLYARTSSYVDRFISMLKDEGEVKMSDQEKIKMIAETPYEVLAHALIKVFKSGNDQVMYYDGPFIVFLNDIYRRYPQEWNNLETIERRIEDFVSNGNSDDVNSYRETEYLMNLFLDSYINLKTIIDPRRWIWLNQPIHKLLLLKYLKRQAELERLLLATNPDMPRDLARYDILTLLGLKKKSNRGNRGKSKQKGKQKGKTKGKQKGKTKGKPKSKKVGNRKGKSKRI